jgi:hypothetical protein
MRLSAFGSGIFNCTQYSCQENAKRNASRGFAKPEAG